MQLPVQLDVTPVIQKVYVIRLDARQDISTQQDISVSVSFYSNAYISYFLYTVLSLVAICKPRCVSLLPDGIGSFVFSALSH